VNSTAQPLNPRVIAIIPARYASTRLPGKPLLDLGGKLVVARVLERALAARNVSRAIVATDDERIFAAVSALGYEALMTRADHQSGSDRLAEVAQGLEPQTIIVNAQGDEPFVDPRTIERAVEALANDENCAIVTTCEPIADADDVLNPNIVKVVTDTAGRALYFSRSPAPFPRDAAQKHGSLQAALRAEPHLMQQFRKHTGLYVYRREFLLEYTRWPQTPLEKAESLEQLRALERGAVIRVVEAAAPSLGIDTPEDLARAQGLVAGQKTWDA
jgi:3-deoxy-manno-octulosonate cytidylyltransferase (CMP-KDO synthetase)